MKRAFFIISCLILGLGIYWIYGSEIFLFKWLGFNSIELNMPDTTIFVFIRNYLPDLLWAVAVSNTAILLAEKKIDAVYIYLLVALPFISEILQTFHFIPGTFDWYDLFIYFNVLLFCFKLKIYQLCKRSGFLLARSSF